MPINKLIQNRIQRITLMIENSAKKIVKKEIGKFKRDIKKELLNKLKENEQHQNTKHDST